MDTYLVTGGAGFIGSNLCEYLLEKGNRVICIDDLSTGFVSNLKKCKTYQNFEFINHDVIKPFDFNADYIFNLACPASPPKYQKDPLKTIESSIFGIINALNNARKYGATILQSSTSEVYGNPLVHPQNEDYWGNTNPVGLRSCYDEGKRVAETIMMEHHRKYGTKIKIARIFNTYGPKMDPDDGRVVSNVVMQAINDKPITIYGDGTQTRSFCYITDTILGLYKLMHSGEDVTGPINIGNPSEFTINELVGLVKEKTNTKSITVYAPLPSDDPVKRKPDITRAKNLIEWAPEISLDAGLDYTIEYFRTLNGGNCIR